MTIPRAVPRYDKVVVMFDGNCRLGDCGAGAAILYTPDGEEIDRRATFMCGDDVTNNICEYVGLANALQLAIDYRAPDVKILGDSELIIRHFNGQYQCRKEHLKPWLKRVQAMATRIPSVVVEELPRSGKTQKRRELNGAADAFASECMKARSDLPIGTGLS